ncbi:MAG: GntR family transcriptional regulator [Actinomycetota bacterium]
MSRYLVEHTAEQLRQRAARAAADGAAFPTESELIEDLEVSRTTVREAISRLEAQGMLKRRHGTATSINSAALELSDHLAGHDIGRRLAGLGDAVTTTVLDNEPSLLAAEVAQALRTPTADPARRVRRLWMVDQRAVGLEIEHFVLPTWPMTIESPDADVFELSEHIYGESVLWRIDTTDADRATGPEADLLKVDQGSPVLVGNGLFVTASGRRVAHTRTVQPPNVAAIASVTTFPDRAAGR